MHASHNDNRAPDPVPAHLIREHNLDQFNSELVGPYLVAARLHDGESYAYHVGGTFGVDQLPLVWN